MKKQLAEYFNKANNIELPAFPISDNQLRSILGNTGGKPLNKNNLLKLNKGAIIMDTLVLSLAGIMLWFSVLSSGTNLQKPDNNDNSKNNNLIAQSNVDNQTKVITLTKDDVKLKELAKHQTQDSSSSCHTEIHRTEIIAINGQHDNKDTAKDFQLPVIVLNDKELENLKIFNTKNGYLIESESKYDSQEYSKYSKQLENKDYPPEGIYHQNGLITSEGYVSKDFVKYDGWDLNKSAKIYPLYLYQESKSKDGSINTTANTFGYSPAITKDGQDVFIMDLEKLSKRMLQFQKDKNLQFQQGNCFSVDRNEFQYSKFFVPVILRQNIHGNITTAIVWYSWYPELAQKLPKREHDRLFPNSVTISSTNDSIKNKAIQVAFVKYGKEMSNKINPIAGIEKIILNDDELKNLGIVKTDSGYSYLNEYYYDFNQKETVTENTEHKTNDRNSKTLVMNNNFFKKYIGNLGYDTTISKSFSKYRYTLDTLEEHSSTTIPYGGWDKVNYNKLQPVALTHQIQKSYYNAKLGKWQDVLKSTYEQIETNSPLLAEQKNKIIFNWEGINFKPVINTMIPVYILLGSKEPAGNVIKYGEINLWFVVNPEFVSKLPDRYRIPLENELKLTEKIEKGEITTEDACEALKGEKSYFGFCELSSINIGNVDVFPNPITDNKFDIRFSLKNTSVVKLVLFDYSGQPIKSLISNEALNAGINKLSINIHGVKKGIYMIAISDENGGQAIQKVIVN